MVLESGLSIERLFQKQSGHYAISIYTLISPLVEFVLAFVILIEQSNDRQFVSMECNILYGRLVGWSGGRRIIVN